MPLVKWISTEAGLPDSSLSCATLQQYISARTPLLPSPVRVANAEEVVVKALEAKGETEVKAAMAALRQATWEGAARWRVLCGPRLLAALRRVLLPLRNTASWRVRDPFGHGE